MLRMRISLTLTRNVFYLNEKINKYLKQRIDSDSNIINLNPVNPDHINVWAIFEDEILKTT